MILPKYPIYVPSKGRYKNCLTARFLTEDGVPFYLVVEEQERDLYAEKFPTAQILVLPFSNLGSVIPARNWIKEHATALGHLRHWQLDDNILRVRRFWKGKRIPCSSGVALAATEDFTDRYENVAVAGLNYQMFAINGKMPPFCLNVHVYSCTLVLNSLPNKWRGRYNEDTDLCLQVLADVVYYSRQRFSCRENDDNEHERWKHEGALRWRRAIKNGTFTRTLMAGRCRNKAEIQATAARRKRRVEEIRYPFNTEIRRRAKRPKTERIWNYARAKARESC